MTRNQRTFAIVAAIAAIALWILLATVPERAASQTISGCGAAKPTKAESTNRAALTAKRDCFRKAGSSANTTADALDALIAKLPTPRATPTPTPTPTRPKDMPIDEPAPVPTPSPTPDPSGQVDLPKVADGLNINDFLVPAWGTGELPPRDAGDDVGAFRFICDPSHNAYNDPIVYPGQPGKSHLHTFFGNTLADANSTYETLRKTGDSTCNNMMNRSAYWIAAMMNGAGKVVMPDYLAVYYKRMPKDAGGCTQAGKACVDLPRGLRYVFGFNMLNPGSTPITEASKYQRWWNCDGPGAIGGHFGSIKEALAGCPLNVPGVRLGEVIVAPNCWDGVHLDSPDHRSHVGYMDYRKGDGKAYCPDNLPYIIPQFQLGAWYAVDATTPNWYLASDRMPGMPDAEPGTTQHADWFGAWNDDVLALWHANCINKLYSCSGGVIGDGRQLTTTHGYTFPWGRPLVSPPAR